jgi:hypothetical protein
MRLLLPPVGGIAVKTTTRVFTNDSAITHTRVEDCDIGWDAIPCLRIDDLVIETTNTAAAYRLAEAAREFARDVAVWETQLVVGTLQKSANDKAAVCAWQPCDSVDCCEFGAVNCPERVTGDPT